MHGPITWYSASLPDDINQITEFLSNFSYLNVSLCERFYFFIYRNICNAVWTIMSIIGQTGY